MGRVLLGRESAVRGLHEEPLGLRFLQELGDLTFGNRGVEIEGFGVGRFHAVAQFGKGFEEGGTKAHLFSPPFVDGTRQSLQAGNPAGMFARPLRERVGVKIDTKKLEKIFES
jgi:hypothetical protein